MFLLCSAKQADLVSLFQSAFSNSKSTMPFGEPGSWLLSFVEIVNAPHPSPFDKPFDFAQGRLSSTLGRGREEGIRPVLGCNRHGHFDAFEGIVAAVAFGVDDAVGDFHAADDFSKCRVLTVQERGIGDADKKL